MPRAGMGWDGAGRTREVGETGQAGHAVESTRSRKEVVKRRGIYTWNSSPRFLVFFLAAAEPRRCGIGLCVTIVLW